MSSKPNHWSVNHLYINVNLMLNKKRKNVTEKELVFPSSVNQTLVQYEQKNVCLGIKIVYVIRSHIDMNSNRKHSCNGWITLNSFIC